jgi:3D-(3,5/4)-trihydroxycyclohexane-1,2-dione acylhydrolase (decyclizing)
MATLLDPVSCGPVTLAFCQDVQAEAFDYPQSFFERNVWRVRKSRPDATELEHLAQSFRAAERPLIVAGGGVAYAGAEAVLAHFAQKYGVPVAETQAGKGALAWDHPLALGSIGVTGSSAANALAAEADLIVGVGTRLQDFTSGSRALFRGRLVQVNVGAFDAHKHGAFPVVGDAGEVLRELNANLAGWTAPKSWAGRAASEVKTWNKAWLAATSAPASDPHALPSDAQVIGAVWRHAAQDAVVVCAAGGLPGELHKLWRTRRPGGYHVEYGYSCMGYEIAGGLGVKLAEPEREVYVLVGDGSYLMLSADIITSVQEGYKLTIVLMDNDGYKSICALSRTL